MRKSDGFDLIRFLAVAILIGTSGCASIFSGRSEKLSVSTSPVRAQLIVKHGPQVLYEGSSPWSGLVRKRFVVSIEARAEGYRTQYVEVPKRVAKSYRLNYILLGLFNGVDKRTGAVWRLVNPNMHITMVKRKPKPEPEPEPPPTDIARKDPPKKPPKPPPKKPPTPGKRPVIQETDIVSEADYDGM